MASRKAEAQGVGFLIAVVIAIAAAAVAFPFLGGRNLTRGYQRNFVETILMTWCSSLLLIALGFGLCVYFAPLAASLGHSADEAANLQDTDTTYRLWAIVLPAFSFALGLVVGLMQRSTRLEGFAVAAANDAFLLRAGIRATGATDVTHYDGGNNPLRYIETRGNEMVFMAVGRRNRRAYIELDATGRMIRYSGIIPL